MRKSILAVMWVLAIAMLVALPVAPVLADPPTLPADKVKTSPGNIPPVPRGIPDLTPYWNFDPPKHPLFDISKLTVSGDARIRAEYRNNDFFQGRANDTSDQFVQQWMRLGINYAISQDVDTFIQMQYAKNWGGGLSPATAANDASVMGTSNGTGSLGVRQAYIMIRNLGVEGLSMKAGRQLLVMGNHRLFGHFDWNNIGFSHDGITLQYNQPKYEIWGGWVRLSDAEAVAAGSGAGGVTGCTNCAGVGGGSNADLLFTRLAFKPMAGLSLEPLWVFFNNKTATSNFGTGAGSVLQAHAPGQNRHTLGGRAAFKQGMFDATAEYYWQTGSMQTVGNVNGNNLSINAQAFAAVVGATFKDVAMQPRVGLEFNYASGDNSRCGGTTGSAASAASCGGNANTFENLYPTNHIVMGYADRMAWRNMVGYSADVQLKPTAESHFELKYWIFQKANRNDCWYQASQSCVDGAGLNRNNSGSLYQELDGIYTLFFAQNKVAWQTGVSYLFAGALQDQYAVAAGRASAVDSIWGYTQLHVNF